MANLNDNRNIEPFNEAVFDRLVEIYHGAMPPAKLLFHNDLAAEFQTDIPLPDECFMCNMLSKEPPALQAIINPLSLNQCMPQ